MRSSLVLAMALAASMTASAALAGDVYQWKDPNGITQFTSTPPTNAAYTVRPIRENGQTDTAEDKPVKPAENADCTVARGNLKLLESTSTVQMDSDGDGKPDKTLTDEDRADQMQFAQATMKVKCETSAPATDAQSTGMLSTNLSSNKA